MPHAFARLTRATSTVSLPSNGALAALSLSVLLAALGTSAASVALPALARAFGASFHAVQWVVVAYLVTVTASVVGAGRLSDALGRRRLLLAGIATFTIASLLCALAPSLPMLVAARAVQGIGASLMMALTLALVGEAVPPDRTGRALGGLGTMSAIGTALGPSLGGVLVAAVGWRAVFLVNVPLGAAAFALAAHCLARDARTRASTRRPIDAVGMALLALTLAAYSLGVTPGPGRFSSSSAASLALAMLGAALFVRRSLRVDEPLLPVATLRDGALATRLLANALVSAVVMATLVVGPFHLTRALALSPALVGLAMSVGPVVTALTGVPAGRLTDRHGAQRVSRVGLAAMTIGALATAALAGHAGVAGYVIPIAILTAGYALFQTANTAAITSSATPEVRGVIAGLLGLSRNLGLVSGASLLGALFAWASGTRDAASAPAASVAGATRITFGVVTALVVVAAWLATERRGHARREAQVLAPRVCS